MILSVPPRVGPLVGQGYCTFPIHSPNQRYSDATYALHPTTGLIAAVYLLCQIDCEIDLYCTPPCNRDGCGFGPGLRALPTLSECARVVSPSLLCLYKSSHSKTACNVLFAWAHLSRHTQPGTGCPKFLHALEPAHVKNGVM